jgi:hypothetical protein
LRHHADAADQLAQDQHGGRHRYEADDEQHRILDHHDDCEADQGEQIAADRQDQQIKHLGDGSGTCGKSGDEIGRVSVGEIAKALIEQPIERPLLNIGDDAAVDAREYDRLAVGARALEHVEHHGCESERDDRGKIFADIGLVDEIFDQIRRNRRARGSHGHEREGEAIALPAPGRVLQQQAPDQRQRAFRVGQQRSQAG